MATANPAANVDIYRRALAEPASGVMTLPGTVLKCFILLAIVLAAGGYTYAQMLNGAAQVGYGLLMAGCLGGLAIAFVTITWPRVAPVTAPLYAGLQGLVMGAISAVFEARYQGLVVQAVGLTVGVLAALLIVYGTGLIRATERFKIGVVAATGAICLVYIADMILSFFSIRIPFIHESGLVGIGFSAVVVVIAALNLILDFDFIERGVAAGAPKYMEWYGGFSLLVTLVWMYLEILRLLSKMRDR